MTTIHDDLGSLDDWLLQQGIEQAEREVSIEDQLIPETVKGLGQPHVYLYATVIFDGEVANGGLQQFFENASGALAPTVRDALREMTLGHYASLMTQIINAFGLDYPVDQWARVTTIEKDPVLQEMLERSGDTIDVWSSEFILARTHYARKHNLMK